MKNTNNILDVFWQLVLRPASFLTGKTADKVNLIFAVVGILGIVFGIFIIYKISS